MTPQNREMELQLSLLSDQNVPFYCNNEELALDGTGP